MTRPFFAAIFILSFILNVFAQTAGDSAATVRADSVLVIDTLQSRYISGLGEVVGTSDVASLSQDRLRWTDSKNLNEALSRMPANAMLELGEAGQATQWFVLGEDVRANALLMDGRPMNDPATGAITLSDFPFEFIDEIQAIDAPGRLFSSSAAGSSFNIVTRSYNSVRPITRIRFLQDPRETMLTDVFFSQNILRGTNLLFGFQRQSSAGRYFNAKLDEWNLRTRLRWNASDVVNISLTHLYLKSTLGMNGGVDLSRSVDPFEVDLARSANEVAYGIRERHDLTLAGIGRLFDDSTSTTKATAYLTTVDREYASPSSSFTPVGLSVFLRSTLLGLRVEQNFSTSFAEASFAGEQEWRGTENTGIMPFSSEFRTAGTALLTMNAIRDVKPRISVRMERMMKVVRSSFAAGLSFAPSEAYSIDAEVSDSYRFPTLQEMYWTDSLFIRRTIPAPEHHRSFCFGGSFRLSDLGSIFLSFTQKTVANALAFRPDTTASGTPAIGLVRISERNITAATATLSLAASGFSFDGGASVVAMKDDGATSDAVPGIILNGEVAYQGRFFVDALNARVGIRTKFSDRFRGEEFDPRTSMFYENTRFQLGRTTTFDAFGVFHVGDAYITVAFLNLLSADRLTVPVYPLPSRQFRLGVNWTFLD